MNYSDAMVRIMRFQQEAPVDVSAVAKAFGLNVWVGALDPGVSGKLFPDARHGGASGYSIVVNRQEGRRRQRFTVAHEIGHFICHGARIGSGVNDDQWYRSNLSTREEAEANRVAAEILMPLRLVNRLRAEGVTNPDALADRFEVSPLAMRIRLGMSDERTAPNRQSA
jgi:hypothetical protein